MSAGKKVTDNEKKTIRLPLVGVPNWRSTSSFFDQLYINTYTETIKNPTTQNSTYYIYKRPGLSRNLTYGKQSNGTGRGCYYWRGKVYSIWNTTIYSNTTPLAAVLTPTQLMCSFTESQDGLKLIIGDGISLFIIDTVDNVTTVSTATDPDFPSPYVGNVIQFDGYFVLAQENGKIWNSAVNDPTSWGALDFLTAESFPDTLVGNARQNDVYLAFGVYSTQMFYDAGTASPGSFMSDLAQATLQIGCAGSMTIAQQENTVIWVARAQTGGFTVQKLDGVSKLTKISTPSIEKHLNASGGNLQANTQGFIFRSAGHIWYILNFIGENVSYAYDLEEDRWTPWQSGSSGVFTYVDATQNSNLPPNYTTLLQHSLDGFIYEMSPDVYLDNVTPIEVTIRTANQDQETDVRKFCTRLSLIGDRYFTTNPVQVSYSDDDYQTYGPTKTIDLVRSSTNARPTKYGWGQYRRRAWKLFHNSNMPLRLEALEMDLQVGEY